MVASETKGPGAMAATAASLAAVGVILALHYAAALHSLGLHDLLRRLFYVPVITAAIAGGLRGGLLTAGAAALGYLPHLGQLARAGDRVLDHALELMLLPVVAVLVGGFADASRRARALAAARGRMAALGEVGMAAMTQLEGPLSAIEGQAESLAFLARQSGSTAGSFAAGQVHAEVARARRLMADLRGLGHAGTRRVRVVQLSSLLGAVVADLAAGAPGGVEIRIGAVAFPVPVRADGAILAWALRTLLAGLREAVPAPGAITVGLTDLGDHAAVELEVRSGGVELPDLEGSLERVFGAGPGEYRVSGALCVHLLRAEGAAVEFAHRSPQGGRVRVRFDRLRGRPRPPGAAPARREREHVAP